MSSCSLASMLAVVSVLVLILTTAASAGCDVDDRIGQRMVWVPNCEGVGCMANRKDQECAWCVYNLTQCTTVYGKICYKILKTRNKQGISCTGEPFRDVIFELDASQQNGSTVVDRRSGIEFGELPTSVEGGVTLWDLDSTTLTRSGGGNITEGKQYTHVFWVRWRPNATYRTLFHHSREFPTPDHVGDHCEFTQSRSGQCPDCNDELGVQCNRANPPWRRSGYDITPGVWSFVVSVGLGDNATSPTGTTLFYVGGSSIPVKVGTSDRVCSGMSYDRIGWPTDQGPGKLGQVWGWSRALASHEILDVYNFSRTRYYGHEALVLV